jgi:hypothetical protein
MVDCGTTAGDKQLKILNTSPTSSFSWTLQAAPVNYTVSVGGTAVPAGVPQALAANTTVNVTVTPKPIPFPSLVSPNLYGETLTITTDATGDTDPHTVTLLETAHGAILSQSAGRARSRRRSRAAPTSGA